MFEILIVDLCFYKLNQLEKIICIQPRNIALVVVKFGTYK